MLSGLDGDYGRPTDRPVAGLGCVFERRYGGRVEKQRRESNGKKNRNEDDILQGHSAGGDRGDLLRRSQPFAAIPRSGGRTGF